MKLFKHFKKKYLNNGLKKLFYINNFNIYIIMKNFSDMKVIDLKKECKKLKIKGYSKLRKNELIELLKTHNIKNNKDDDNDLIQYSYDIKKHIDEKIMNLPIPFEPTTTNALYMYMNILKRSKNDCIIIDISDGKNILKNSFLELRLYNDKKLNYNNNKEDFYKILNICKKKNNFVIIPLKILKTKTHGHLNMLMYNPYVNIIEHYEPHGDIYKGDVEDNKIEMIYKILKKEFNNRKIKYLKPNKTCPISKGLQELEELDLTEGKIRNGFYIKDPGGFCMCWSFYLAELRLSNPKLKPEEIYKKAFKILSEKPEKLRDFIRNYSRLFLTSIKTIGKPVIKLLKYKKLKNKSLENKKKYNYYKNIINNEIKKQLNSISCLNIID
jgi:hypothetical protein